MPIQHVSAQFFISGSVFSESGEPLEGVDVYLHETHQGTATDESGFFKLTDVRKGHYHLHVTFAGYHSVSQDIILNQNLEGLNFQLEVAVNELHQVIIENSLEKTDIRTNPKSIVHVDQHYLEMQGGSSFMKNLEVIPGVASINNGVGVSKPVIRGLHGNRVVMTINGIKQEGQQWGEEHGLEIDPNNAEQVEIIKGPSTLMYGSDAVAGVINVRPTLPKRKDEVSLSQRVEYQSINHALRSGTHVALNRGGNWFKLRYGHLSGADYSVPVSQFVYQSRILPMPRQRLKNTALNEDAVNVYAGISRKWGYAYLHGSLFDQTSGFFTGAFGIPTSYDLRDDGNIWNIDLPYQRVRHTRLAAHGNFLLGKNWLEVDAGYQNNHRMEVAKPHSAAFSESQDVSNEALLLSLGTYSVNARYFDYDSSKRTIVGMSLQHKSNGIDGYEFIIPAYTNQLAAIYALFRRDFKKGVVLNYGARLEYNDLDIQSSTTDFYRNGIRIGEVIRSEDWHKQFLQWSASIGYNRTISDNLQLKSHVARTSRVVQANEIGANGLHHGAFRFERGSSKLDPETAVQSDISLHFEHKRLLWSISGYYNYFQNFIYLNPSASFARLEVEGQIFPYPEAGQLFEYVQSPAHHLGYEFEAEYKLTSYFRAKVNSDYVLVDASPSSSHVPFVAPFSVKPTIEYLREFHHKKLEEIHIGLRYEFYGAQNRVPRNDIPTEAYQLVNGVISMSWSNGFSINLVGSNLFNTAYFNNLSRYKTLGIPEPGRNLSASIKYMFGQRLVNRK